MTLCLGERTVVRCDDGLLAAEYAAFDAMDIVLEATDPVSVREKGYRTTAGDALARLARANVTPALAEQAARSLSLEVASSFARGAAARSVISHLGAQELFDGAIFRAKTHRYEGAWLDLAALSSQLEVPKAPILLQALHLAAAFAEVPPSTPLYLSTAPATCDRLPGERTHARVDLEGVLQIPEALVRLGPSSPGSEAHPARDRRMRRALLARVRERLASAEASDRLRMQLERLDSALAPRTMSLGPLAYPQLQAIERQLASGDARGIDKQLEELERDQGSPTGIRYLRARAALLRGDEPPRTVAELLSELGRDDPGVHQAILGTARKWLAVGQKNNARHFALHLARDPSAPDSDRLGALDILERTGTPVAPVAPGRTPSPGYASPAPGPGYASPAPGPGYASPVPSPTYPSPVPSPEYPSPATSPPFPTTMPVLPRQTMTMSPAHASSPQRPQLALQSPPPPPPQSPLTPPFAPAPQTQFMPQRPAHPHPTASYPPPHVPAPEAWPQVNGGPPTAEGTLPNNGPLANEKDVELIEPRPPRKRSEPPELEEPAPATPQAAGILVRYRPELVESLPLPSGATEATLDPQQFPKTPLQVRVAMVRCARELGRDYRVGYGKTLRCDVLAVDMMQEHLMRCCVGRPTSDETVAWEVRRHGALLSEIIARALGGVWTDVGPSEPGYWTMAVPRGIRCWPIGRVHRFVAIGSRGKDLVAYYLDLEARVRAQR